MRERQVLGILDGAFAARTMFSSDSTASGTNQLNKRRARRRNASSTLDS